MDIDASVRDVYDYLRSKFSESDLRNPRMYDEIVSEIKNGFGEAILVLFVPILIRDIYGDYNGTK